MGVKISFKRGKKDKKEIESYRPLAVANAVSNIFGGKIKKKMGRIIEEEELISESKWI